MKIRLSIDVMMLLLSTVRTAGAFTLDQRARSLGVKGLTVRYMGGGKGKARKKKPKNVYAPSILLPQTTFEQRANAIVREPELQQFWSTHNLYHKLSETAAANQAPRFVLHDGPPYANGDLHIGHALNKVLKDFINRREVLKGKQVHYVPGWDCHGLPIELKVLQSMKKKERAELTPLTLRAKAAEFAKETVTSQSTAFQRYGIFGDFENPYLTLQPSYEAAQIGVFGEMFQQGYIFRGRKPVHWSPSSQTALAEAELEYPEGHVSTSVYVAFDILESSSELEEFEGLRVAVWTTTPWTMPANMAVAVNPELEYSVVEGADGGVGKLIVATGLVKIVEEKLGTPLKILKNLPGSSLLGTTYQHPLYPTKPPSPILAGGDYITTESGTGLVHTAPGHGQEDYLVGIANDLDLVSPVDDVGKFTIEAGERFQGLKVLSEGNVEVVTALNETGSLLKVEPYGHKYPYDWRTKKPTIFRATDQWFASVEGFRDAALAEVKKVKWIPEVGENRINSFVSGRGDWCISRQRSWGVPIPVFYDRETGNEVLLNEDTLTHIQSIIAEQGCDAWWKLDEVDLLPESYKAEAHKWKKGTDTMDVWFDSGSSWAGVAKGRDELAYPADVYLEGSDQHRGWFQSSLLTSVAANGQAPYKAVLTHGFVLDEKGFKMSKSLGNVVSPMTMIEGGNNKKQQPAYGIDPLRLWVASVDYSGDVCIGDNIMKQTFESYRKLRNTARYLIGNLADYVPDGQEGSNAVPYDDLPSLDKWMLGRLSSTLREVNESYDEYQFYRAMQALLRFTSADLSNFYLDVAKDRLYISAFDDVRRRTCQTVLHACLEGLTKAIAPILPHMAEDIWQNIPYDKSTQSVFEGGMNSKLTEFEEYAGEQWDAILELRDDINKVLEIARTDKLVGASLDASVHIYAPEEVKKHLIGFESDENILHPPVKTNGVDDLRTVLMISQVHLVDSPDDVSESCDDKYTMTSENGVVVGVKNASGNKCGRCWFFDGTVGRASGKLYDDLCPRCSDAVFKWEELSGQKLTPLPEPETIEPVTL